MTGNDSKNTSQKDESAAAPNPLVPPNLAEMGFTMKEKADLSRNPGMFEDMTRRFREIQPIDIDGLKIAFNRPLSSRFQMSYNMLVTQTGKGSGLKVGANYAGSQMYGPGEVFPLMIGEMDMNGGVNATIIHQFTNRLRNRLSINLSEAGKQYQLINEYRGRNYSVNCTLVNIDPFLSQSGIVVLQYLQRMTNRLKIGAEYVIQKSLQIPGGLVGVSSFGLAYSSYDTITGEVVGKPGTFAAAELLRQSSPTITSSPSKDDVPSMELSESKPVWQFSGTCSPMAGSVKLTYVRSTTMNKGLEAGVEMETSMTTGESSAALCYQYEIPKTQFKFNASFDTNLNTTSTIEKGLKDTPITFSLSTIFNHAKQTMKFGFGLIMG